MASLNTLRTKGGWIISIVIGLALLAFILPEVFRGSGGMNPDKIKVGEINGEKVSWTEYNNRNDYYNVLMSFFYGRSNFSSAELDQIQEMAWNALIMEHAFNPGFGKLGLIPLDAEKEDMVVGTYISPVIMSEFRNQQTGMFDPAYLAQFVNSVDEDPALQMRWDYIKSQMVEQRALLKYMFLVAAGINVTDMELEAQMAANGNVLSAQVVAYPYSEVPDSLVNVTNADIKKYYDTHKEMFRQTASRDIEYVVFDVLPSESDYAETKKIVDQIAAEFTESTTPVQFAALNTQTRTDNSYKKQSEIPADMAAVIWDDPEAVYGPVLSNDVYTIARIGDTKMIPDSLGARHILIAPASNEIADSLINLLNNGVDFAKLAEEFSVDPTGRQVAGDLGRFTPDEMIPEFSEPLVAHKVGDIFKVQSPWGMHVVEKTYETKPEKKARVAVIEYTVDPSGATEMEILNKVREFQNAAYGSYDNFRKAVSDNLLSKRVQRIQNTDRNVIGLPDSKELVRWAFNNEKGTVSDDIRIGMDTYVVAVLTNVIEDGIMPLDQCRDEIRTAVTRRKKGELMAGKMTGNTIGEVASVLGKEPVDVKDVRFAAYSVPGMGAESALVGAMNSGIAEGVVSKPVVGDLGVYRFVITGAEAKEMDSATERVVLESAAESYLDQRLMQALTNSANITDSRAKYF